METLGMSCVDFGHSDDALRIALEGSRIGKEGGVGEEAPGASL